ncbi:MAG TPA: class I SAM-dependent methyltransferase [Terriglobales bacterium]|nr:class I SAM-dependent methyltransferase [Terriglobales bacterium]
MSTDPNAQRGDTTLRNISDYFDGCSDPWRTPYVAQSEAWHEYLPIKLRESYALEFITDEPKGTAIDLGCGIGHALIQMKQAGFDRVIGVDISPNMLADAGKLLEAANMAGSIELYRCDVRDLKMIESGSVDACMALGVIEYHPEDAPLLTEVNRILKPNGAAVIQTRNFWCLNSRTWGLVQRLVPRYRRRIFYREHRPPAFRSSVAQFGFRVEKQCFSHFYAMYPFTAVPVVQTLIKPINNFFSKPCEGLRSRGFSMFLAATYMAKLRKISELS